MATGGPLGADGGPRPIGLDYGAVLKGSPNGVESPSSSSIFLFERSIFNMVTFFFFSNLESRLARAEWSVLLF